MEFAIDILLHWMPFYQEIKLGVYVYLAFYNGTAVVYESYGKEAFQAMEDGVTQLHEQGMQNVQYKVLYEKLMFTLGRKTD
mmetsp:Transcript_56720/g.93315  ORF Transcript_56720/g.93315 Transcript_56720/m.93315 type:complete len:81 (-) Transcript_56720:250-492(-)